jgi:hypothetical protein
MWSNCTVQAASTAAIWAFVVHLEHGHRLLFHAVLFGKLYIGLVTHGQVRISCSASPSSSAASFCNSLHCSSMASMISAFRRMRSG